MFDKPIYLDFAILELSSLFIQETFHDILHFLLHLNLEEKLQLNYMDCDSVILSIETNDLIKDLVELQKEKIRFDFNKKDKDQPLYCDKNTNVIDQIKLEIPDTKYSNELRAVRSK